MKVDYRTLEFLGNNVKYYRDKRRLTQLELADSVLCRKETIARIEKGTYNPTIRLAFAIAFVLGVKVDDLYRNFGIKEII